MEEALFCKHCGKKIAADSLFCQHCGGKLQENVSPVVKEERTEQKSEGKPHKKNHILPLFLWAIAISAICTIGYAVVRNEDAKPYDSTHYWGSSAYDTDGMLMGDNYGEQLTWMRKEGYEKGIKNMALYSFPISFGILLLGAILINSSKNK